MTIAELIKELEKYPPTMNVAFNGETTFWDVVEVELLMEEHSDHYDGYVLLHKRGDEISKTVTHIAGEHIAK
jgi:hypothetical protein